MTFRFLDRDVATGAPACLQIPVCTMASGHRLTLPVHVLPGRRSGPAVLICAGSHGEELWSSEFVRRVADYAQELAFDYAGTLLLAPVLSPHSFEAGMRNTPFDHHNLNRVFPGGAPGSGWYSELVARAISQQILPAADIVFDYHGGGSDTVIRYHYTAPPSSDRNRRVHAVALASGAEVLWEVEETRSTLTTTAEGLGKLCVVPEVGGGGQITDAGSFDRALAELANMLRVLEVIPGEVEAKRPRIVVRSGRAVRPAHGGTFVPTVGLEVLGKSVPKGTVLGRVVSPYSFELLDELVAPYERSEIMQVRNRISRVHPGDYAYIVGDGDSGYEP